MTIAPAILDPGGEFEGFDFSEEYYAPFLPIVQGNHKLLVFCHDEEDMEWAKLIVELLNAEGVVQDFSESIKKTHDAIIETERALKGT